MLNPRTDESATSQPQDHSMPVTPHLTRVPLVTADRARVQWTSKKVELSPSDEVFHEVDG